jgi:hypothetical protein
VAHDEHRGRTGVVVTRLEEPAERRLHAEHAEVVGGHVRRAERSRRAALGGADAGRGDVGLKPGEIGEFGQLLAERRQHVVGKQRVVRLKSRVDAAVVGVAQPEQLVWPRHWQWLQHDAVDQREDCRVGAQAQSQCHDGYGGETRLLPQAA